MKYRLEILIDKPRVDAWKALVDGERTRSWQPTLVKRELLDGLPGHEGALTKLTFREQDREYSLMERIIACESPSRFVSEFDNEFAVNTVTYILAEHGRDQTRLTAETRFKFKTLVMKVVGLLMKKNYVRRSQRELERFKAMVEAG